MPTDPAKILRRERVATEIVAVTIPLLAEAVAVMFFIAVAILVCGIRAGSI